MSFNDLVSAIGPVLPDNTSVALDIESTDAKDYVTISTDDSNPSIILGKDGAEVGIGVASPDALLHVQGTAISTARPDFNADTVAIFENDSNCSIQILTKDASAIAEINMGGIGEDREGNLRYIASEQKMELGPRNASSKMGLYTAGSQRIHIDASGNTSVGASTPKHLFHVQDGDLGIVTNSADTVAKSLILAKSRNNTDGNHTVVNNDDSLGTIKFTGSDGDSFQEAGQIEINVDGTPGGVFGVSTSFSGGVGAGYSTGSGVATTTTGGTGSGATVNINEVNGSGAITSLSVNAKGSGYDTGDTFTVNGGSSLATCTVISGVPGELTLSTTPGSSAHIHGASGGPVARLRMDHQGVVYSGGDTASLWNFQRYLGSSPTSYAEIRTESAGFSLHSMYQGNNSEISFLYNYVERYNLTSAAGFQIFNGYAVPGSSVANGVILYSEDVNQNPGSGAADYAELKVRDEIGNITTLSPHNFSVAERSDPMAWSHYGKNPFVGKEINVDMMAVIKAVEQLSGQSFIQERDLDPSECRDWDTEELARVGKSQEAIDEWELKSDEDKSKIPRPELYVAQPKPDWMN